ncbi:MAG: hypothetical protein RR162_02400 [Oscillospiraceae bacterium]
MVKQSATVCGKVTEVSSEVKARVLNVLADAVAKSLTTEVINSVITRDDIHS